MDPGCCFEGSVLVIERGRRWHASGARSRSRRRPIHALGSGPERALPMHPMGEGVVGLTAVVILWSGA
jgi:hypothetical protein